MEESSLRVNGVELREGHSQEIAHRNEQRG